MKYNLNEILKGQKEEFYSSEPSIHHMSIFEEKLSAMQGKKKFIFTVMKYAASLILIIGLSVIIWIARQEHIEYDVHVFDKNKELIETEQYYKALLDQKYTELDKVISKSKTLNSLEVKRDLREFSRDMLELKKDWEANPGDERIASNVISSYILHLEALDQIIQLSKRNLT